MFLFFSVCVANLNSTVLHDVRKWRLLGCPVQVNACMSKLQQGAGSLARLTLDVNKVLRIHASTVICNA